MFRSFRRNELVVFLLALGWLGASHARATTNCDTAFGGTAWWEDLDYQEYFPTRALSIQQHSSKTDLLRVMIDPFSFIANMANRMSRDNSFGNPVLIASMEKYLVILLQMQGLLDLEDVNLSKDYLFSYRPAYVLESDQYKLVLPVSPDLAFADQRFHAEIAEVVKASMKTLLDLWIENLHKLRDARHDRELADLIDTLRQKMPDIDLSFTKDTHDLMNQLSRQYYDDLEDDAYFDAQPMHERDCPTCLRIATGRNQGEINQLAQSLDKYFQLSTFAIEPEHRSVTGLSQGADGFTLRISALTFTRLRREIGDNFLDDATFVRHLYLLKGHDQDTLILGHDYLSSDSRIPRHALKRSPGHAERAFASVKIMRVLSSRLIRLFDGDAPWDNDSDPARTLLLELRHEIMLLNSHLEVYAEYVREFRHQTLRKKEEVIDQRTQLPLWGYENNAGQMIWLAPPMDERSVISGVIDMNSQLKFLHAAPDLKLFVQEISDIMHSDEIASEVVSRLASKISTFCMAFSMTNDQHRTVLWAELEAALQ